MLRKACKQVLLSCIYQPAHKELYLLLAKGLMVGNLFWLLGDLLCSSTLGLAAFVSEMLIFYISFLLILGVTSTFLIKRLLAKSKLSLGEMVHQNRTVLFLQLVASLILTAAVSISCLFAALSKALRSLPVVGYLFRETYYGVEPLFALFLVGAFLIALALPLVTPFLVILSKYAVGQWSAVYESKIKPRIQACLPQLFVAFLFWLVIEGIKWLIEWCFPVQGLLSAAIRASLYTLMETLVFWASMTTVLDAARTKL